MKKLFALLFTAGVALSIAPAAQAQTLKVKVPFDFVVNGKTMSADVYKVQSALSNDSLGLAFLGNGQGIQARASEIDYTITGTKLVFRKLGDEYFLSDVVTLHGALHFAPSRYETERIRMAARQSVTTISADN
ncbi:MAG TPA: hypothetical protein VG498_06955 [Terriglobales bacterium]|nr:hypothetical protein [Terriglobales bacterium]